MIVNFKEVDKKIEKILNILVSKGFSYEIFSEKRFNIIDNNVNFAEKRNIGVITQFNDGKISVRIYGHKNRHKLKDIMKVNEVIIKSSEGVSDASSKTTKLVNHYIKSVKSL